MSAPRIVGKNYTDATRFARETLGLSPNTFRVTTTVGGLAGYGYTLHLAPGWSKAPYAHAIRNKIKFKRGIEVIDHEASVQKESAREVEDAPEPPEGWFVFGTHVDHDGPIESSDETDEAGMPKWERPVQIVVADDSVEPTGEWDALVEKMAEPEIPEEPDAPTGTPESGEDAEGSQGPKRRKRRCKKCGILVHPDDVEEHAALDDCTEQE